MTLNEIATILRIKKNCIKQQRKVNCYKTNACKSCDDYIPDKASIEAYDGAIKILHNYEDLLKYGVPGLPKDR